MEQVLLILVPKLTPRITYTFSLFFDSIFITPYKLTEDAEQYKSYTGPKFSYLDKPVEGDGLFFCASGLLSETGIHHQSVTVSEWNGLKIFYQVDKGALPFDIFSAAFYLVSRYEEYLADKKDEHGRYLAEDSLAYKNQFLNVPLVNLWALELKKLLLEKYPSLKIEQAPYKFIPTIDIDLAYAYLGRGWKIASGAYLFALVKLNLLVVADKTMTLLGLKKDKYDTYDYQETIFKKYKVRPIYFFLAAKRAQFDKNISTDSKRFADLVKRLEKFGDIGIHPSYQSESLPEIVEQEKERVEKYLTSRISKSRQHFLKLTLPDTYRCLTKLNITDDYSLAHATVPGFRASICTPFFFYDLISEETLPVKIHPTIVMEGTLRAYLGDKPDEAIPLMQQFITETRKYNGEFVCIWHNHTIGETSDWKGWRKVFEAMMEKAS